MAKVFCINPGSTSTKVALFEDGEKVFGANVSHSADELAAYPTLADQLPYREAAIQAQLDEAGVTLDGCDAFVGRGGGLLSMEGGVYEADELVLDHSINAANGVVHPACLGPSLASRCATRFGGRALVVNPPDVDEYADVARVTGVEGVYRTSHVHALNHKEVARRHAESLGKRYDECNLIVCHLGGGLSIAAHQRGRMVDGNDNVGGEGPMAPTRCGSVPVEALATLVASDAADARSLAQLCTKSGGFVSLLGTSDAREVVARADAGDEKAKLVWDAMVYQIAKYVGSMACVLHGDVDGILLSGGMVFEPRLVEAITEACGWIAPVTAYPGEFEMEAMAAGAEQVLSGEVEAKRYTGRPAWDGFHFGEKDTDDEATQVA